MKSTERHECMQADTNSLKPAQTEARSKLEMFALDLRICAYPEACITLFHLGTKRRGNKESGDPGEY